MHARPDPEHSRDDAANTDDSDERALRQQAQRCRRLANATYDRTTSKALGAMADVFNRSADRLARKRDSS